MYGENTKTVAIPIYKVLPHVAIYTCMYVHSTCTYTRFEAYICACIRRESHLLMLSSGGLTQ